MTCGHFNDGECLIASSIAGLPVIFDTKACGACEKQEDNPQGLNKVTVDLARKALVDAGRREDGDEIFNDFHGRELIGSSIPQHLASGVGRLIADRADWVDLDSPSCKCRDYVAIWNKWGPEKCLQNRQSIVRWLMETAKEKGVSITEGEVSLAVMQAVHDYEYGVGKLLNDWPFVWTYWAGGAEGDELRYSIRSVLAHHPNARVVVVGDRPDWYTGEMIECPRIKKTRHHAFKDCYHKLLTAAGQIEQFVWMMDDVYWVKPFDMEEAIVPKYVRHVSQQRYYRWKPGNKWAATRADAYQWLLDRSLPTYDFAAHLPQPIQSETFLANEDEAKLMESYRNWECIYFNRYHSAHAEDWGRRFLRINSTSRKIETKHKILNHTSSQFHGAVEDYLMDLFPNESGVERQCQLSR